MVLDFAPAGMPTNKNAVSVKTKEIFVHLPKHDGETEEIQRLKGFAISFTILFIALEVFWGTFEISHFTFILQIYGIFLKPPNNLDKVWH